MYNVYAQKCVYFCAYLILQIQRIRKRNDQKTQVVIHISNSVFILIKLLLFATAALIRNITSKYRYSIKSLRTTHIFLKFICMTIDIPVL